MPTSPKLGVNKLNEKGVIHLLLVLILIAGLFAALYLVQKTQIFKPKATSEPIATPTTSFSFFSAKVVSTYPIKVGDEIQIPIVVRSDLAAANLFTAKINFDPVFLQLGRVDTTSPFIKNWAEQNWSEPGKISLVGGVPDPGFQSSVGDSAVMATLYFKALKSGSLDISFGDDSAIYSNADNANILVSKNPIHLTITNGVEPSPACINPLAPTNLQPSNESSVPPSGPITLKWDSVKDITRYSLFIDDLSNGYSNKCDQQYQGDLCDANLFNNEYDFTPTAGHKYQWWVAAVSDYCSSNAESVKTSFTVGTVPTATPSTFPVCPADINCDQTGSGDIHCLGEPANPSVLQSNYSYRCLKNGLPACCLQPSATPAPGTGDGNGDGKTNLVDLSVLLSDYNKQAGFRVGIDMNGDGRINSFDFFLMRTLLIQKGVIKS